MNGSIIKIISNFVYVEDNNNNIYECKSKGIFRYKNIKPMVGDLVKIDLDSEKKGIITEIFERKNFLLRPLISNIDQVIIITSCKEPKFSSMLLNKYLFIVECLEITPILLFTKKDLLNDNDSSIKNKISWYDKLKYKYFIIDNKDLSKENIKEIKLILANKISVFAGQTGAGKSTTINNLLGYDKQKTDKISKSLGRGKHTTRMTELFLLDDVNAAKIADSPGFSALDIMDIDINMIAQKILPFKNNWKKCKFKNCIHINEPKCKIKELVSENKIPIFFYEDYKRIISDFNNKKGR